MLQFRAGQKSDIKNANCEVDAWVIPRALNGELTLRYALYRFIVQGIRRCQGANALPTTPDSLKPADREFFSGRPVWNVGGKYVYEHPGGWERELDEQWGAFYWIKDGDLQNRVWDTKVLWSRNQPEESTQANTVEGGVIEEDIYNA